MKILYITNHIKIQQAGGYINDYMNDLLFYGLYELRQEGVVTELTDSTSIVHLYKDNEPYISKDVLWGKGFSHTYLIEGSGQDRDRSNIIRRIVDQEFDVIIFGAWNRCQDYRDVVEESHNGKVIVVDGADDTTIRPAPVNWIKFKRELMPEVEGWFPISFAIPECKFSKPNKYKSKDYATIIPGDESTYIFTDEKSYYKDYNDSYYGVTTRKAGVDCMRHYEIIASYCMPYIPDLSYFPATVMTNYPKDLVYAGMALRDAFTSEAYYALMDAAYQYAKENLTTKALAKYVLSKN